MADTNATLTIRSLVDELLLKNHVDRNENFYIYARIALDVVRELMLYHMNSNIYVKVTPDSLNRISLPSDCLNVIGVYTFLNGKMTSLTREDRIVTTTTGTSPNETQDANQGEGVKIGLPFVYGYVSHGGANVDGFYHVDENARVIWINGNVRTQLILGYVSSGISQTDTFIPVVAKDAIEMGILSRFSIYNNPKMAEFYKKQYEEKVEMLRTLNMPSLEEIQDQLAKNNTPLPQR
jgi:hypothetical protein